MYECSSLLLSTIPVFVQSFVMSAPTLTQSPFVNPPVFLPQTYPLLTTQLFVPNSVTPIIYDSGTLIEQMQTVYSAKHEHLKKLKQKNGDKTKETGDTDPLAHYIHLPEEYFTDPKKNKMLDANYFIDAFCSAQCAAFDLIWLLDIDLGSPIQEKNRAVATYDVQLCKIVIKNSSGVEHPSFTKCNKHLQQLLLYYYDSVVSAWYLGYIAYYGDMSVSNFQDWLSPIMDCLGVCWR